MIRLGGDMAKEVTENGRLVGHWFAPYEPADLHESQFLFIVKADGQVVKETMFGTGTPNDHFLDAVPRIAPLPPPETNGEPPGVQGNLLSGKVVADAKTCQVRQNWRLGIGQMGVYPAEYCFPLLFRKRDETEGSGGPRRAQGPFCVGSGFSSAITRSIGKEGAIVPSVRAPLDQITAGKLAPREIPPPEASYIEAFVIHPNAKRKTLYCREEKGETKCAHEKAERHQDYNSEERDPSLRGTFIA